MEFYTEAEAQRGRAFFEFQFPTGWNSTLYLFTRSDLDYRFQFPTGWNSTTSLLCRGIVREMFQFPTGWNSTMQISIFHLSLLCFNSQRDGILLYRGEDLKMKECFNSQRDGILLWDKARFRRMKKFQFPTGWNSTRLTKAAVKRDRFQFPTGWNSTLVACFSLRPLSVVSIPNGMEFYRKFTYALPFSIEFQFPTGWNSTRLCWQRNRTRRVSIPNGMEFYLILKWMKDLDQQVSIPNGMEFYKPFKFIFNKTKRFQFPTGWNSTGVFLIYTLKAL